MKESMNQDIQLYREESGHTHKDLEDDMDRRGPDLSHLDSVGRRNREVLRVKKVLDNM